MLGQPVHPTTPKASLSYPSLHLPLLQADRHPIIGHRDPQPGPSHQAQRLLHLAQELGTETSAHPPAPGAPTQRCDPCSPHLL